MEKELKIKISIDKNTGAVRVIGNEFDDLNNKVNKTEKSASSLEKTFLKYASIGGVIYAVKQAFDVAYAGAKKFVSIADDMSLVSSRLSLVTKSTEEYSRAQKELLSISNTARTSIKSTTDLYSQLSRSTQSLGINQKDLLQVTDTISKSLTISGASAVAADAALLQLSQGFASGTLRGEELNSVLEQAPRLAQAIADGMGVSIGQLRSLGAEGQLTAQTVLTALQSQATTVDQEFSKIAINAGSGYQVLNNVIDTTVAKIDGQYKVTQAVGQVFIAVGNTVDTIFTQMTTGWNDSSNSAMIFGNTLLGVIKGFVTGAGYYYDFLESIVDIFQTIRYAGETAYYGIEVVAVATAYAISYAMENSFNFIINGINGIISYINEMMSLVGGPQFGFINSVNFTDTAKETLKDSTNNFMEAATNLKNSASNYLDSGNGAIWAETINATLDLEFKTLLANAKEAAINGENNNTNANSSIFTDPNTAYEDYLNNTNNTVNTSNSESDTLIDIVSDLTDSQSSLNNNYEDTISIVNSTNDSVDTLNTTLGEDGTYNVITKADDEFSNLNNTLEDVSSSAQEAEQFIFQFSDTLLNTFSSSADSLLSVVQSSATVGNEITYQTALENMQSLKEQLIANPLDKDIATAYANGFNTLKDSAANFLDINNFSSQSGYDFAVATVNSQLANYQNTAAAGYSVLESMNDFLESINTAFEDGILSDEEKATISSVADNVNANNDILLGTSGAVVGAVNSQEYYNNIGLATDANISAQEYFNNSDLVGAVNNQEYYNNTGLATDTTVDGLYKGGEISTTVVNQINDYLTDTTYTTSGFAKDTTVGSVSTAVGNIEMGDVSIDTTPVTDALNGSAANSVTAYIQKLMGANSSGISLSSISSSIGDLSVDTGLDVSQLSNLNAIKNSTSATETATEYMTSNNTTALKNLKVKSVNDTGLWSWYDYEKRQHFSSPYRPSGRVGEVEFIKSGTDYKYYADGGYTGPGYGRPDHTGFKQAGIVHEDEWVAPKWQIQQNPGLFAQLEQIRQRGSFAQGGFTSPRISSYSREIQEEVITRTSKNILEDIKQLSMNQYKLDMKLYKLFVRLTNGGESMLIEGTAS